MLRSENEVKHRDFADLVEELTPHLLKNKQIKND